MCSYIHLFRQPREFPAYITILLHLEAGRGPVVREVLLCDSTAVDGSHGCDTQWGGVVDDYPEVEEAFGSYGELAVVGLGGEYLC